MEDEAKKATKAAIQNGGKKQKGGKKNGKKSDESGSDDEKKVDIAQIADGHAQTN